MLYAIYSKSLGRVVLHMDTVHIDGFETRVTGYDDDHNRIDFVMDKFSYLDDYFGGFGYCRIASYIKDGIATSCSEYHALS